MQAFSVKELSFIDCTAADYQPQEYGTCGPIHAMCRFTDYQEVKQWLSKWEHCQHVKIYVQFKCVTYNPNVETHGMSWETIYFKNEKPQKIEEKPNTNHC